jgi:hypothetical protein
VKALLAIALLAGCAGDIDPQWQLDHDRIVAVRATPPHLAMPGDTAQLDLLVGHKGAMTTEQPPDLATVITPASLAGAVSGATVTAPSDAQLAAARTELKIADGMPVPLTIGVSAGAFAAIKTVWLGEAGDNPVLADLTVSGVPPGTELVVPPDMDVRLFVTADDSNLVVNWLTSCGTMHDFDLHSAYLHVLPADPQTGELAIVVRDSSGGVAWQTWPIHAE